MRPQGHPWLKPIRFHKSYRPGKDAWGRGEGEAIEPGVGEFFQVRGDEIHEVAVGPVHAGIIEPGHFRFPVPRRARLSPGDRAGLPAPRDRARALRGGPDARTLRMIETVAGDTTIGHAMAYCQGVESLAGCHVPARAEVLRAICLELERLANHAGDLGALAGDVGVPADGFLLAAGCAATS